jgi:hypothetical protein
MTAFWLWLMFAGAFGLDAWLIARPLRAIRQRAVRGRRLKPHVPATPQLKPAASTQQSKGRSSWP